MQKVPAFFDWRDELSRWRYFTSGLNRSAIYLSFVAFNMGLNYLFGWTYDFKDADVWSIFEEPLPIVASCALFLPIDIRRANDAGLSGWFIFVLWCLTIVPSPPDGAANEIWGAYALVVLLPFIVMQSILHFKPGRAYREWIRSER